jgi:lipopolysaccharide transport system permease protein
MRNRTNAFVANIWLAWDLAQRDLRNRYRRSTLGPLWLLLTPCCYLLIYSIIFGVVFGVSWKSGANSSISAGYVLPFFTGLVAYLFVVDVSTSASTLFAAKRTFVVKSPFPIWVLWLSDYMRASVHFSVSLLLLGLLAVVQGNVTLVGLGGFALGVSLLLVFAASISLLLASLGPFIGDIAEGLRLFVRILFYASPITYPLAIIPEKFQILLWLNPMTALIESLRAPLVFGESPAWANLGLVAGATAVILFVSLWVFKRVKKVIPDVV